MKLTRIWSVLLFSAATLVFVLRGPVRMMRASYNDLSSPYVSSRLWLGGANPYDSQLFMSEWTRAGGAPFIARGSSTTTRPAYPPPTLPVLAPLAAANWKTARVLFALMASSLFALILWRLRHVSLVTLVLLLAMSSIATCIGGGNIAILAIELAVLSSIIPPSPTTGVLLGLSICLKPQLAVWLLLYYVFTRRWSVALTTIATVATSTLIALSRMPGGWLAAYLSNLSHFLAIGGVNDFTTSNPSRFELLNLQVLVFSLAGDYALSNLIAWIITGALLSLWSIWCLRKDTGLLALATVSLIGLLPLYQRLYNLPILLLFVTWAIRKDYRWLPYALIPLSIPWTAIFQKLSNDRLMTGPVWNSHWLYQVLLLPHLTWIVLALIGFGLFEMRREGASETVSNTPLRLPYRIRGRLPRQTLANL
ncbi:MAG TPA: glycosyltransferase family 87 protein [Terriglobales bacterium]